jgi:hypothetical protein
MTTERRVRGHLTTPDTPAAGSREGPDGFRVAGLGRGATSDFQPARA